MPAVRRRPALSGAARAPVIVFMLGLLLAAGAALTQEQSGDAAAGLALRADVNDVIGPAAAKFAGDAIEEAREREAEILILQIDTPGGLATSMRDIIKEILASPVPVVGYVAPSGARAASAGTYILYATHAAAMAPGTNLGAATPVQIGGGGLPGMPGDSGGESDQEDKDSEQKNGEDALPADAMKLKTVNDAVAFIRGLAELRGRNAEWAEKAVREAASLSAGAALDENVIDLLAASEGELLEKLDGRTVTIGGESRALDTEGIAIERIEPGLMTKLLGIIANPNIALILMMIGVYGLIFELASPGAIGPGVVGAICLILGLYALNQLPLDYAGLALVMLGVALMVAEAVTPTFGVIGLGGIVAFVIGAAMLIDTDVPEYQVSWAVIGGVAAISGAVLILLLGYVWRSLRRPPASLEAAGGAAEVLDWTGDEGHVWSAGERWRARSRGGHAFRKGDEVRIETHDGLTLVVGPSGRRKPQSGGKRSRKSQKGD